MQPLPELVKGLEVLKLFLKYYDFAFDKYENGKGSGGQFSVVTFKKNNKKFILGYRYSIGYVIYQCDESQVSHDFYLNGLGFAEQKQFPDFQSDDKLLAFHHVLHDFQYLINDFFAGECLQLKFLAKQQMEQLEERIRKSKEEGKYQFDRLKIERARQAFKKKDYHQCYETYRGIEYREILTELDKKTIAYCRKHIHD
ncbi:hypothetical protein [Flavisolibacter ginsenosidimutans]|uniref:Uncharacterized protein n=1 Tax=Flavisolibacter ginsenosidimutans TaxID=661481 RepID=A0A5B8UKP8_9BACT|nr:hypothetical protein [Flavisolibacter ginsenosidimutans]QEC57128.1 hypothetical protein FSB75_14860 [Flavisolibacter ginsenosidimutans]